jgi:antitoxin YefM
MMGAVTYTDLRANLASYMDKVCDSRDTLVVTRQNARSVVIMAEEEYESLMETFHLLRSPANAAHLLEAIRQADAGLFDEHDLIEPELTDKASS